ncbi:hypothetical protein IF1G_05874 [Cordyceps javanica]|uniref:Uncharacterized protein n=1 Tax=Cordyceps javanica TaxID=43265 RepID=A0A545V2U8_9HYPO|nr:hypothetical protein IF1G_05874 [Cordyceps javanica]
MPLFLDRVAQKWVWPASGWPTLLLSYRVLARYLLALQNPCQVPGRALGHVPGIVLYWLGSKISADFAQRQLSGRSLNAILGQSFRYGFFFFTHWVRLKLSPNTTDRPRKSANCTPTEGPPSTLFCYLPFLCGPQNRVPYNSADPVGSGPRQCECQDLTDHMLTFTVGM